MMLAFDSADFEKVSAFFRGDFGSNVFFGDSVDESVFSQLDAAVSVDEELQALLAA